MWALAGALVSAMEIWPLRMVRLPTDRFCSSDCSEELFCSGEGAGTCSAGLSRVAGVFPPADLEGVCAPVCPVEADGVPPLSTDLLPTVEKFHVPDGFRRRVTCGRVSVRSRTSSVLEKISGTIFTPTSRASALMKGALPNEGSSSMAMLSADRLPDHSDRLRFPTVTLRPRALVSSDSILGLNTLTLIRNGRTRTRTIKITI